MQNLVTASHCVRACRRLSATNFWHAGPLPLNGGMTPRNTLLTPHVFAEFRRSRSNRAGVNKGSQNFGER